MVKDGDTPLYLMGDHLGSTSLVVNTNGAQVAKRSYLPFGAQWAASGSLPTDFGFTGQREAGEIGLYYYVARWYDVEIGHFAQADTIVPGAGNPAAYNRYGYVMYNPVRYTDPSGHISVSDDIDPEIFRGTPCTGDFQVCLLNNGAIFDRSHYNTYQASFLWNSLVNLYTSGVPNGNIKLDQSGTGFDFVATYYINFNEVENQGQLAQIAIGIWLDFQIEFEKFQGEVYPLGVGVITEFTIGDVPSAYLAMAAEIKGMELDEVIDVLGGGIQLPGVLVEKLATLGHGQNNSENMINIFSGDIVSYPEVLNISPVNDSSIWYRTSTSPTIISGTVAGDIINFWNDPIGSIFGGGNDEK
jgi:RHS repeat-associated protein